MKTKTIFLLALVVGLIVIGLILIYIQPKKTLLSPLSSPKSNLIETVKEIKPSETDIEYTDPAGFGFSYPDNLSISKAEIEDSNTYADLEIFSKDLSGSITLKMTDSKFRFLDDWLKANQIPVSNTPKEVKLGDLAALEVRTSDRLLLGALDKGVLFTLELPLIEEEFWMRVYHKILTEFTFVSSNTPTSQEISKSSADIIFEGEEVVE